MRFTFIHKICLVLFFLPEDYGILRRYLDQHKPLARPLRNDDLLAQPFLRHLDMQIIGRADHRGRGQESHAQACDS